MNRDHVAYIVKHKDISQLTKEQLKQIDQLLSTVKICDPAIGSGAFPMGLLQEIHGIKEVIAYELKSAWKPAEVKENIIQNSIYGVDVEKGAVDIARLRFWLSLVVDEEKPRALPNLDYKIVVGDSLVSKFEGEIIEVDWEQKQHTTSSKIFIENIQRLLKEIAGKQRNFFKPETKDKKKLQSEIRNLKLELLINQLSFNREKFLASNKEKGGFAPSQSDLRFNEEIKLKRKDFDRHISKIQNLKKNKDEPFEHFDWKLDFPDVLNPYLVSGNIGFDIVIANPPYLGEKGNKEKFHAIKLGHLRDYYNSKMDLFYFFFHLSINFLKDDGTINFITTNYYPTADGALKLRQHFKSEMQVLQLVNFNEFKIFDSALGQHNIISFLKKSKKEIKTRIVSVDRKNETGLSLLRSILTGTDSKTSYFELDKSHLFEGEKFYMRITQGLNENLDPIFHSIKENAHLLGDIANIQSGCDVTISRITPKHMEEFTLEKFERNEGVFVLNSSELALLENNLNPFEKTLIKPYLKNSNIDKYVHSFSDEALLYIEWNVSQNKIPNLIKHLKKFKPILDDQISRYDEPNWPWYSLHRPRERFIFENPLKIIVPYRSKENTFALAKEPAYSSRDVFYISLKKESNIIAINSLLAILNSKLIYFWLCNKGKRKGETLELYYTPLSEIPISKKAFNKEFAFFVDSIIFSLTQNFTDTKDQLIPTYFEQIIDGMVYEIYFPELLKKNDREILKHLGDLPELTDKMSGEKKMSLIKTVFNRLNEKDHPVRLNLFYMNSIPEIAIIEGKHAGN